MRLISGSHKGRRIFMPNNLTARPTTDFAKSALFNILQNYFDFDEIKVLDLCAGTGSIGLEFASRGAVEITCVELDRRCAEFIKTTAQQLQFNMLRSLQQDVKDYISRCKTTYDVIYADPPYREVALIESIPDSIFNKNMLAPDGWLIVEHDKHVKFKEHPKCFREESYGHVHLSFFKHQSTVDV